ncbi:hypothetical protein I3271_05560 [Photobacterium leiognathi]|uniref:hypothetical protein n=1 Tax=Photobacterium leiognathi TaxID=553611 RepID=UPI001EE077A4|nr:hypothetical protein [Photobacterium leiognathi]MCG3884148.1 hypothetical protein [Photobacterium leiognathi]
MSALKNKQQLTEAERQDLAREKSRQRQAAYRQRKQNEAGVKPVLVRITERAHKQLFKIKDAKSLSNLSLAAIHCIDNYNNEELELAPLRKSDPQGSRQMPLYFSDKHKEIIKSKNCWWLLSAIIEKECAALNLE